jgi:hypothetical protein
MKFLRRIVPLPKKREQENNAKAAPHRRVEVTVDRELVSVLAPVHLRCDPQEASQGGEPVQRVDELPPVHAHAENLTGLSEDAGNRSLQDSNAKAGVPV